MLFRSVSRSEAKRKLGDNVGADRDYWAAIKMEEQAKNGQLPKTSSSGSNTAVNGDAKTDDSEENTREQSDKNINKFNRLVVYDKEQERKSKYQSEVRGRVQDRNVHVDLEPQFVLTYYEKADPVKKLVYYDKMVEDYNGQMVLKRKLRITNEEAALTEDQIAVHFASIDEYSAEIERDPNNANAYFGRAMDFMLVQDFSEAIKNFSEAIERDPSFTMAYFNRAVERYKQLMYTQSQQASKDTYDLSGSGMNLNIGKSAQSQVNANTSVDLRSAMLKDNKRAYEHEQIMRDYDMVIKLNPEHLGELTLKVSVSQSGSVNASFHSENAQVRTAIENSLVQLRQELNNQGLKVDSVEVYAGLADGQLPQDQGQQAWQNNQQGGTAKIRNVQLGADEYNEDTEVLSAVLQSKENTAMEGVDYRI